MSNTEEHVERHKMLHKYFDELLADFIGQTKKLPSETTVSELCEWSSEQTKNPVGKYREKGVK